MTIFFKRHLLKTEVEILSTFTAREGYVTLFTKGGETLEVDIASLKLEYSTQNRAGWNGPTEAGYETKYGLLRITGGGSFEPGESRLDTFLLESNPNMRGKVARSWDIQWAKETKAKSLEKLKKRTLAGSARISCIEGIAGVQQDSYYGGGQTYEYQGDPLDIIIKTDEGDLSMRITSLEAWCNGREHRYFKVTQC